MHSIKVDAYEDNDMLKGLLAQLDEEGNTKEGGIQVEAAVLLSLIHIFLFVVDVMNGVTDLDMQVAAILRRANSPVIMVANKTDNHDLQYLSLIHI